VFVPPCGVSALSSVGLGARFLSAVADRRGCAMGTVSLSQCLYAALCAPGAPHGDVDARPVPIAPPFIRPGVIPTSTPHMDRLLGPQGIGQAGSDKVDTDEADEVIDAIAKTVAELTSQQDGVIRQQLNRTPDAPNMRYDGEFRREEATSAVGSNVKH